jgi:hypothetical protein
MASSNASSISARNNGCLDAIAIAFGLVLLWPSSLLEDRQNGVTDKPA